MKFLTLAVCCIQSRPITVKESNASKIYVKRKGWGELRIERKHLSPEMDIRVKKK